MAFKTSNFICFNAFSYNEFKKVYKGFILLEETLNEAERLKIKWKYRAMVSRFFLLGDRVSFPLVQNLLTHPADSPPIRRRFISALNNNFHVITHKNWISSCSHCSYTIFILISYSLYAQIMLILVLIDLQYLQNVVFSFAKCLNSWNHFSSDFHHPIKKFTLWNFPFLPEREFLLRYFPLTLFGKLSV